MGNKIGVYVAFFILLLVGFWYFLFKGTDNWKKKPAVLSLVKPFQFLDQDKVPFTERDMFGKVVVVNYFFTRCKGICPSMNRNMYSIYKIYEQNPDFMIVSHTSDPDHDSSAVLKEYANEMGVDTRKWVFLTGRKDSLYFQARVSYLLDDPKNTLEKIEDQFIHTQFFALVDKTGKVRGRIYDGLKQDEIEKLKTDIAVLLKEQQSGSNFTNNIFGN